MVVIEFGSLKELADVADNYHTNINKLYGNFDEFKLAIDKVVWNIVVSMYAHYIDWWPINGACVGHQDPSHVVNVRIHIHLWTLLLSRTAVKTLQPSGRRSPSKC